ncbi:hypothetical protein EMMF5_002632 [Cystobasidiomycetes sp. EMM_F5]
MTSHLTFDDMLVKVRAYLRAHTALHFLEDPDESSATWDEHSTYLSAYSDIRGTSSWTSIAAQHVDDVVAIDRALAALNKNNGTYAMMGKHKISFTMYHLTETLRLAANVYIDEGKPVDMSTLVKSSVSPAAKNAWRDRQTLKQIRTVDTNVQKLVKLEGVTLDQQKIREDKLAKISKRAFLTRLWNGDKRVEKPATVIATATPAPPAPSSTVIESVTGSVPDTQSLGVVRAAQPAPAAPSSIVIGSVDAPPAPSAAAASSAALPATNNNELLSEPKKKERKDSTMMSALYGLRKLQKQLSGSKSRGHKSSGHSKSHKSSSGHGGGEHFGEEHHEEGSERGSERSSSDAENGEGSESESSASSASSASSGGGYESGGGDFGGEE